jgi:hypothetical protein
MRAFYCQLENPDSDGNRIRVQCYLGTLLGLRPILLLALTRLPRCMTSIQAVGKALLLVYLPSPWISLMNSCMCPVLPVVDLLHQIEITANICPECHWHIWVLLIHARPGAFVTACR